MATSSQDERMEKSHLVDANHHQLALCAPTSSEMSGISILRNKKNADEVKVPLVISLVDTSRPSAVRQD